jgi:hypothetical protein
VNWSKLTDYKAGVNWKKGANDVLNRTKPGTDHAVVGIWYRPIKFESRRFCETSQASVVVFARAIARHPDEAPD